MSSMIDPSPSSATAFCASLGMSTTTGPGRPETAMCMARSMAGTISAAVRGSKVCLMMGPTIPRTSVSWNASRPMTAVETCPVMATTGTESMNAHARPVTRFVAPGPLVTRHTPGRPVARA